MMNWLASADYLTLWIAFAVLTALALWTGDKAAPHLDNKEQLAYRRPMFAFELAGSVEKAQKVLDDAEAADLNAREKFKAAISWDYLFIAAYLLCGVAGCLLVIKFLAAHNLSGTNIGFILIALLPLAALLDVVENDAMKRTLGGPIVSPWPQVAKWCAIPKFAIGAAVLLFGLFGVVMFIATQFKK
jgi:hypothetical protein